MKKYLAFYIPYFIFIIVFSLLILNNEKADLHLWLTSLHTNFSDIFFRFYTEVGGSIPFIIAGVFLFVKYRISLYVLVAQLTSGLIVQIAKRIFEEQRPKLYFQTHFPDILLHKIDGVNLYSTHSFPSGHTCSAFALFLTLSFFTKKPLIHFIFFIMAFLVGYSRIYLSQHFALDVLVGSMIGVLTAVICRFYLDKFSIKWADGSLKDIIYRKVK
ncbi:MAG: phosphatase PAP2 family protein [Paludibacter sp.]|nr:phosphatase PAP2 family protein [Paludibacter sp.]